jgi:hypothetical protein
MLHSTVVPLNHADVAQSTDEKVAVGVRSIEAKARPLSIAIAPPEEGALPDETLAELSAGASNEKRSSAVPDTEATVIVAIGELSTVAEDIRHATVVPLVHAEVAQMIDDVEAVGVGSAGAKARPLRVAVAPPEWGAFLAPTLAKLTAGASNENNEFSVPETEATVIVPVEIRLTVAADMLHSTVVPLVHADVAQSTDATVAVGVRSINPKARPLRVAIAPPEVGALTPTLAKLTAGASKEKRPLEVPDTDATVIVP